MPHLTDDVGSTRDGESPGGGPPRPDVRKGDAFEHDGGEIPSTEAGSVGPVLLVHGYPVSGTLVGRLAGPLSPGNTVIAPDLHGDGLSRSPAVTSTVAP